MSLRTAYCQHAHERQTGALVKKMTAATAALVSDIGIVKRRAAATGLKALFAPLATGLLSGTWSRENNTLSYTLVRDQVDCGVNYNRLLAATRAAHRDWMREECRFHAAEQIETRYLPNARLHISSTMMERHGNALLAHDAYRALHRLCADPAVDVRVELVVAAASGENHRARFSDMQDYYVDIDGKVVATPRLQVRLYLDQPYSASTDCRLATRPAPTAGNAP